MANMSYCRFENTYQDLVDCHENLWDACSPNENKYRERLVKLANAIAAEMPISDLETLPVDNL